MKKPFFSPLAPKAQRRRPEMVRLPKMAQPGSNLNLSEMKSGFNPDAFKQICTESFGAGLLLGIAQLARVFVRPKPAAGVQKNINPKKQLNPSTSFRPS